MLKIGILKERKPPADKRAPFSPSDCGKLLIKYAHKLEIFVESDNNRIFSDADYLASGCIITNDIQVAEILFGVKEVPPEFLIANKTYFIFSHTIKGQVANMPMLKKMLELKIKLIDYELLKNDEGRLIGFGTHAGIVGAYNGIKTWGLKFNLFELPAAHQLGTYNGLIAALKKIDIPCIKMALTGSGRVAQGAAQLLDGAGITEISKVDYLTKIAKKASYVWLKPNDLFKHKTSKIYNKEDFHKNHQDYFIDFKPYIFQTDLLINGIFWSADMDRLFDIEDIKNPDFKIQVIADISCDINGAVPITYKDTKIEDPVIGFNTITLKPCEPYTSNSIDIMAVSNLPCELPTDASTVFSQVLSSSIIPELFEQESVLIERAVITNSNGQLNNNYKYIKTFF